jgi:hypothetical protein
MSLFPKISRGAKPKVGSAAAKRGAPKLELLEDASGTKALAFGLSWAFIATAGGRDEALKRARAAGASHYIYRGQQLGMGTLDAAEAASLKVFPAAHVAAKHLPGNAICALSIGVGEYWIAAISNGNPTSTDLFLQEADDAAALEHVRQIAAKVYPGGAPSVYTNIQGSGIDDARSYSADDLFDALVSESETLQQLPKQSASIPKPVLIGAVVVMVIGGIHEGYDWWQQKQRAKAALLQANSEVDPAQAWAQALSAWESGKAAADGYGLLLARNQLVHVPVRWDGWVLGTASCQAGAPGGGATGFQRSWTCQAQYTRGPSATVNRQMAKVLPAGWQVQFTPLNGLLVTWSFMQPARPLSVPALPKADYFKVEVASRLQEILPALASDVPYTFVPVDIPAPKKRDGTALPTPPEAQGITVAAISVKAPMRSIDALIKANVAATWQAITISYDNQDPKGSLKASSVMAEAKGEMYARN